MSEGTQRDGRRLDRIVERARALLEAHLGTKASGAAAELIKEETRSVVVRLRLAPWPSNDQRPTSVIVKYLRDNQTLGFNEWASLAFLSSLEEAGAMVPAFLCGDRDARLFVMEDLGGSRSLHDVLRETNAEAAQDRLTELARLMGRLCVATQRFEAEYDAIRREFPAALETGRACEADRWLESRPRLDAWFEAVGISAPQGFDAARLYIARVYRDPDQFLCFSHGDPAPTNNHVDGRRVRLLDFEYGGYRHALYDITAWNLLCPLPKRRIEGMKEVFRAELERGGFPCSHGTYEEAWATLCAFRGLAILTWISPDILVENRPWVDETWTSRHAVMAALDRLCSATNEVAQLLPVHQAAQRLGAALRERWREFKHFDEIVPQWPAFSTGP